jgi:hypothetical protein
VGARNRVGIGLLYRPAILHRLGESVPWNRFLGFLKVKKYRLSVYRKEDGEAEDHILVIDEEENSSSSNNAVSLELFLQCSGSVSHKSGSGSFLFLIKVLSRLNNQNRILITKIFLLKI